MSAPAGDLVDVRTERRVLSTAIAERAAGACAMLADLPADAFVGEHGSALRAAILAADGETPAGERLDGVDLAARFAAAAGITEHESQCVISEWLLPSNGASVWPKLDAPKFKRACERLATLAQQRAVSRELWRAVQTIESGTGSAQAMQRARAVLERLDREPAVSGAALMVNLADVQPERVTWLWPGRFALGKITLLAGDPGLGKSFLMLDVAARVSRGWAWPDAPGVAMTPGGVVLLSAEDAIADTIRPRLDSAGADVSRIVALEAIRSVGDNGRESARTFDLSRDLSALEAAIRSVEGCRLVVIDPVTAYLGGVDSHRNAEIRGLLAPLGAIAERHRVAIVAITHLTKTAGGPAIYRAMGSLAFAATARSAWAVSKDKDDPRRRLLLPIKNNIAADTGGLAFAIEPLGVDGCPVVAWEPGRVNVSADDALAADRDERDGRTERDDAAEWLRELLANGPCPARDVERDARDAGFSIATVRRAKAAIGVVSRKPSIFGGSWVWALPAHCEDAHPPKALIEDAHPPECEHLCAKPAENSGFHPKMLTSEGVSIFGEHLRSGERLCDTPADADDGDVMIAGEPRRLEERFAEST